jgi:hypothetical protein
MGDKTIVDSGVAERIIHHNVDLSAIPPGECEIIHFGPERLAKIMGVKDPNLLAINKIEIKTGAHQKQVHVDVLTDVDQQKRLDMHGSSTWAKWGDQHAEFHHSSFPSEVTTSSHVVIPTKEERILHHEYSDGRTLSEFDRVMNRIGTGKKLTSEEIERGVGKYVEKDIDGEIMTRAKVQPGSVVHDEVINNRDLFDGVYSDAKAHKAIGMDKEHIESIQSKLKFIHKTHSPIATHGIAFKITPDMDVASSPEAAAIKEVVTKSAISTGSNMIPVSFKISRIPTANSGSDGDPEYEVGRLDLPHNPVAVDISNTSLHEDATVLSDDEKDDDAFLFGTQHNQEEEKEAEEAEEPNF